MRRDLRATWLQAFATLFGPLLLFFAVRWILVEPYVIPSGSMVPTLLIHDHILVNKLAYGLHVPFSKKWVYQWARPQRGDIVVFRYPENPDVFYVKRAIAMAGDRVAIQGGTVMVNGLPLDLERQDPPLKPGFADSTFEYFREEGHWVRYRDLFSASFEEITVPDGHFFVLGDNRDQSNDSRFWGFVPEENLVGRAWLVWLACDMTLPSAQFLCDPRTLRWDRVFSRPL